MTPSWKRIFKQSQSNAHLPKWLCSARKMNSFRWMWFDGDWQAKTKLGSAKNRGFKSVSEEDLPQKFKEHLLCIYKSSSHQADIFCCIAGMGGSAEKDSIEMKSGMNETRGQVYMCVWKGVCQHQRWLDRLSCLYACVCLWIKTPQRYRREENTKKNLHLWSNKKRFVTSTATTDTLTVPFVEWIQSNQETQCFDCL